MVFDCICLVYDLNVLKIVHIVNYYLYYSQTLPGVPPIRLNIVLNLRKVWYPSRVFVFSSFLKYQFKDWSKICDPGSWHSILLIQYRDDFWWKTDLHKRLAKGNGIHYIVGLRSWDLGERVFPLIQSWCLGGQSAHFIVGAGIISLICVYGAIITG